MVCLARRWVCYLPGDGLFRRVLSSEFVVFSSWLFTAFASYKLSCSLLLGFSAAMASPTWITALETAKIPDAVQKKLFALGYESCEAFQFKDDSVMEAFLKHFLVTEKAVDGVSEATWAFHPLVGKLKALWKGVHDSVPSTGVVDLPARSPVPEAGLVHALVGSNKPLSVVDREKMRRDLEKKYTGTVLTLSSLPCLSLLNAVYAQKLHGTWDWIPWKKILSEKGASSVKGRRSGDAKESFLDALAFGAGFCEDQWDKELSAAPFHVQGLLQIRAHAYSMVGAAHLGSWQLYNNKFLEYYTKDVGEHFRFPNVSEAEEADQQAMREIFSLCFNGVNLDDALSSVAVDRDMLRQLLFPRPKLSLKPREKEPLKRSRPGDKPGSSGNAKHLKNGECFHWREGKCKNEVCKYMHSCAKCGSVKHHAALCNATGLAKKGRHAE